MEYWDEVIRESFDETGINATEDQIRFVVDAVKGSHEMYSECHGYLDIPNPLEEENKKLKKELDEEKNKSNCPKCRGKGHITTPGPYHSATSVCFFCNGEGRL